MDRDDYYNNGLNPLDQNCYQNGDTDRCNIPTTIMELVYQITQNGYEVGFHKDAAGQVILSWKNPNDVASYKQVHCGAPGGDIKALVEQVINQLDKIIVLPDA